MVHDSIRERQGQVQKTGDEWEDEVINHILPILWPKGLAVVKGKKKDIRVQFWEQLKVPTKRNGVWGDIDLIVYKEESKKVDDSEKEKVKIEEKK